MFLKISQISHENTYVGNIFIELATLLKRDTDTCVFLWNLRNFEENVFCITPTVVVSVCYNNIVLKLAPRLSQIKVKEN